MSDRITALADFLACDREELDESRYGENTFDYGRQEYLVLTDDEADDRAKEDITESLWAFNASWIVDYLPNGVTEEVIETLQPQCEDANPAILSMIGDRIGELVEDAIAVDGRGHFMNTYDGEEHEAGEYFIYRIN